VGGGGNIHEISTIISQTYPAADLHPLSPSPALGPCGTGNHRSVAAYPKWPSPCLKGLLAGPHHPRRDSCNDQVLAAPAAAHGAAAWAAVCSGSRGGGLAAAGCCGHLALALRQRTELVEVRTEAQDYQRTGLMDLPSCHQAPAVILVLHGKARQRRWSIGSRYRKGGVAAWQGRKQEDVTHALKGFDLQ
jgi:hypothetical protein